MTAIGVKQNRSLSVGHRICSEVHLETTTGLLVGRTRTWSTVLWSSAQSAVQALVVDADGDILASGPLSTYDVNRTPLGHHERTDVWAWQLSSEIATRASQIAIIHSWNPRWLARLAPDLSTLETLTALLTATSNGDVATGEEMRWPEDEMPWARWPGGLVGTADDPRNPVDFRDAASSAVSPVHELHHHVEVVGAGAGPTGRSRT
jgi:hypothetical protein